MIRCGYQVDTAQDGGAGWVALQAVNYDLFITDYTMPKVSGLELIGRLHAAGMTLPIIIASGTAPSGTEQLRSATVLPKPFSPQQLVQMVHEVLKAQNRGTPA